MILQAQKGPFLCNNPMASHFERTYPWLAYVSTTFGRWYYKDKRDLSYVITPWLHTFNGHTLGWHTCRWLLEVTEPKDTFNASILRVCPYVDQKLSLSRECLLNLFHWKKKVAVKADCGLVRPTFGREVKFLEHNVSHTISQGPRKREEISARHITQGGFIFNCPTVCCVQHKILIKTPSTSVRRFLYLQFFLCGYT